MFGNVEKIGLSAIYELNSLFFIVSECGESDKNFFRNLAFISLNII